MVSKLIQLTLVEQIKEKAFQKGKIMLSLKSKRSSPSIVLAISNTKNKAFSQDIQSLALEQLQFNVQSQYYVVMTN
jgi:hypothetical protein